MKTAIIVLADPAGGEEALGRLFNALAAAYDLKQKQQEVAILFQGAGTRWASELTNPEHPVHALYAAVADQVAGVSSGCADVFGARADAETAGFSFMSDNAVPGTSGLPSLARYLGDGYAVLTF
ncbi:MAG TPA: DsrE family protein [Longimicrobiales bacterium]|nr:DsrE family protein [Longimicrobiales bacterium]